MAPMPTASSPDALRGVISAIPTPVDESGFPDIPAFIALSKDLLAGGCDALNVLGTTGEATSFSVAERLAVMQAAAAHLPRERLMVGVGAASVSDARALTAGAGALGFAGGLVLPPFYYKNVSQAGLIAYLDAVVEAATPSGLPLFLYHIPAMSGVPWEIDTIQAARARHPGRIAGLKDSNGDLAYARAAAAIAPDFLVFPSNESVLLEARTGAFAGCISGSANVNADLCGRAWRDGDATALDQAVAIRALFQGLNLVAGVKALLAAERGEPGLARVRPPLATLPDVEGARLAAAARTIRGA